jgi:alpha-tubulin suppressor-like RCC1 family protein
MRHHKSLTLGLVLTSSMLLSACGGSSSNSGSSDSIAPTASHIFPNNNHGIHSKKVIISGQAADETALESVVVNYAESSIVADLNNGFFTAKIDAIPGKNTYYVVVTDKAKNQTTIEESFYFGARASAGGAHSGIIKNERIYAWGRNNKGQSGIGAITKLRDDPLTAAAIHPISPTLISVPSDDIAATETKFVSLAFNQNSSTALDVNGYVWSWGDGDNGQLGLGIAEDGIVDETDYNSPQKIPNVSDIVAISRGGGHCLLLKADGTVLAFGYNAQGQLGDGSNTDKDTVVAVNGLTNIVQISASSASYAIDEEGRLWGWGSNDDGQLANGVKDADAHNIPTQIAIDEPVVSIASGNGHALALTESGKVYAWGLNFSSQVGMRTSEVWAEDILIPKLLPWFDDAIAVWAKGNQSFAQRSDGKIYPWGQNMLGTLGIEQDDDVEAPNNPILALDNVTDLGNGALHTIALRNDGSVFSWGWSFEGSLGGGEEMINFWGYRLPVLLSISED